MRSNSEVAVALQAVYDLGDELDSNHTRYVAATVAERMGIEIRVHNDFSDPPRNRNEEQLAEQQAEINRLTDSLSEFAEDVIRQFGYWTNGGMSAGGLSTLEDAFAILGWEDPHPMPDMRCDEPGCMEQATVGTPRVAGRIGGEYRRTCHQHRPEGWPESHETPDPH